MFFLLFILFVVPLIVLVLQLVYVKKIKYKALENIPGPPSNFFLGNLLDLNKNIEDLFESFVALNKNYGPLVKLWTHPLKPLVVIAHPKFIEKILSSNAHLAKSSLYKNMEPFLGYSLVTSNVETWKKNRKLVNPAFQPKIFEGFIASFEYHGNKFINILKKQNGEIDLPRFVDMYVLDVMCEIMTNVRTNYQETSDNGYLEARSNYLIIFMNRAYSFLKRSNLLFSYTNEYRIHKKCLNILEKFSQSILDSRRQDRRDMHNSSTYESHVSKTVLDIFLDADVPNNEVLNHITTFIVAGHDTPGSTIGFALYEIAQNPEIQKKVLEESISILGKDPNAIITVADMQEMTYLECVIKETLRHHSTIPAYERTIEEDVTIDGITIPKGTEVSIAIFALHHNEEFFPNANVFNPDRFLPENADAIKPYTFIPFSKGPRDCIGKTLSMLLMKSAITKVVRNFELVPVDPPHKIKHTSEFVLKSANGLPVKLKLRN